MAAREPCFAQALFTALFALLLFSPARSTAAEELPFTPEELARLDDGEVVLRHVEKQLSETECTSLLIAAIWVRHPEEVLWEVLNHPERESEWIPGVKKSEVVKDICFSRTRRANTTDYVIGAFGAEAYYSLVREYDYEKRTISGYMDQSRPHRFFLDVKNGWEFFPYKGGTIFQYWSDSKLVVDLPRFISDFLAERTVIAGVSAVAKRCDEVAKEMKAGKASNPCADFPNAPGQE